MAASMAATRKSRGGCLGRSGKLGLLLLTQASALAGTQSLTAARALLLAYDTGHQQAAREGGKGMGGGVSVLQGRVGERAPAAPSAPPVQFEEELVQTVDGVCADLHDCGDSEAESDADGDVVGLGDAPAAIER
jgi:hypothetical protein